jgi:hypothetical protein
MDGGAIDSNGDCFRLLERNAACQGAKDYPSVHLGCSIMAHRASSDRVPSPLGIYLSVQPSGWQATLTHSRLSSPLPSVVQFTLLQPCLTLSSLFPRIRPG